MRDKHPLVAFALLVGLTIGGCTISAMPDGHVQTEWIGSHARQQAAEQDRDRALALRIRQALSDDPVLAPLDLDVRRILENTRTPSANPSVRCAVECALHSRTREV
ncbi:MAG: hypothetical protein L0I62_02840 [Gammaproteobacteria bacterium]|nr:hypothetical protein [Gammaproteobacteria bacterium]